MNKLNILIRFDDICPTMDYSQFKKATDLLDKYNVHPLIGVIPECQDEELLIEEYHSDLNQNLLGILLLNNMKK